MYFKNYAMNKPLQIIPIHSLGDRIWTVCPVMIVIIIIVIVIVIVIAMFGVNLK